MIDYPRFPPVNSGGLIEATSCLVTSSFIGPSFPPVNSGGLIEAAWAVVLTRTYPTAFPPVNSGGLIEAQSAGADLMVRLTSFRR